jgi:hypothetical protein
VRSPRRIQSAQGGTYLYDSLMYELIDSKEVIIDNGHGLDVIFVPDQLLMFNMLSPNDEDSDIFQLKTVNMIIKSYPQEITKKVNPPTKGRMKMFSLLKE